ncbi:hypothetical protein PV05_10073 [Exophiala xenobiotica]|uniref:Uncharacterized protein n=1 Tax=Exophiala xenobiotica TaxID=348802 RepID=A0A0D2E9K4_9EURO|nr:uncharacterized protein PV05_10073 [Exophiala xenobiotica]KIW51340.1 hypothetical protein PV05_10073 [Exophiala xenobiotica]
MPRSPSVLASYRDDELSSPDPLATSFTDEANEKYVARPSRLSSPSKTSAAALKTTRRISSAAFSSSPFRTVSEQNLSPWKIRVTVEAAPEDSELEGAAPRIMARTIKIPLRPDSSPTNKPSSRGRTGTSTGSEKNKRSGTPVRGGRNSSRSRRQSVTDLNARPLGDDAEEDDWLKQKKSPRKKRNASRSGKQSGSEVAGSSPAKATRKTAVAGFDVRQDTDAEDVDECVQQVQATPDIDSPELRSIDLNRVSVRPRAPSTRSKAGDDNSDGNLDQQLRLSKIATQKGTETRKVSANSALSYPTPSPSSSFHGDYDDVGHALEQDTGTLFGGETFDTVLESEGFTMIDLDTLPSARQYRSAPVDAEESKLADPMQVSTTENDEVPDKLGRMDAGPVEASRLSQQEADVSYPALNVEESDISSTVPSSPPVVEGQKNLLQLPSSSSTGIRKVTPQPYSSPKLPSPPRHVVQRSSNHRHRGSASALFAGIALQEVVSPEHASRNVTSKQTLDSSSGGTGAQHDHMFEGFDSGTKRELRAGLRFGEELAKRQSSDAAIRAAPAGSGTCAADNLRRLSISAESHLHTLVRPQPVTQVWRGENVVQRTPVHTSSSTESRSKGTSRDMIQTPQTQVSTQRDPAILDTMARREREWQLEREAVSRQIQNASESQVIVIDSDDESGMSDHAQQVGPVFDMDQDIGGDEEEDIWLAEAKNPSSPPHDNKAPSRPGGDSLFTPTEHLKQAERAKEFMEKPRRSLIPSPWRRGDEVTPPQPEHSTFLSTNADEMSGLGYWKDTESEIKFGAGEIKRQQLGQRRSSGTFDIDLMLGTPRKEDVDDEAMEANGESDADAELEEYPDDTAPAVKTHESNTTLGEGDHSTAHSLTDAIHALGQPSSPEQRVLIPVNFNDSLMSSATSPHQACHTSFESPPLAEQLVSSPQRPPTPRSALKGSRQSLGQAVGPERPDTPTMIRRVVFSQRSRGVDIDGLESSFSMRTASDESTLGEAGLQLRRELLAHEDEIDHDHDPAIDVVQYGAKEDSQHSISITTSSEPTPTPTPPAQQPGVGDRIWGSGQAASSQQRASSSPISNLDGTSSESQHQPESLRWEKTKSSIPSSGKLSSSTKYSRSSNPKSTKLPSYLLQPSYPSDPSRSPSAPLALTGSFTNTHFRTLHILYRKSLRPKFHAPARHTIRPEIMALRGREMDIDETANGIEELFTWTIGDSECEVLERFMQEVEYSHGFYLGRRVRDDNTGSKEIKWGWSVDQLTEWLCRIVVGEVVREEERKGKAWGSD